MLEVHPRANSYETFDSLITGPYVIEKNLAPGLFSPIPTDAERYLKPLDIV